MMDSATQLMMSYAADFEQTFEDDDWSRLTKYFAPGATYDVVGGPMACHIQGREAVFAGIRKSLDGFDRRCSGRELVIIDGPHQQTVGDAEEISLSWRVDYQYGEAPPLALPGRSVVRIVDGEIVALSDHYDEAQLAPVIEWMQAHGQGLDPSYT